MKYFLIITLFIVACNNDNNNGTTELKADNLPGECPYLTTDNKGVPVLSWVRTNADSTTTFCYTRLENGQPGPIVTIPHSGQIQPHGENLPKIIFKSSGEVIALWGTRSNDGRNKYAGLVSYVQSFDNGKTWTEPKPLVSDTAGYDQRYYDVALLPSGEAGIIWLDNRKTTKLEGSGLYFATTHGRNGFGKEQLISQPCCQCCRTDLFVDHRGNIHAIYRGILQDSIRDMVHIVSTDEGATFSSPSRISADNWVLRGCPHTGPAIAENKEGLQVAWFTGNPRGSFYARSVDNGLTFSLRSSISASGSHPQLATLTDGSVVIAWDEYLPGGSEGFKRIGLQQRTATGEVTGACYITADTCITSFPVIRPLANNHYLIAYTRKIAGKDFVCYRQF